MSVDRTQELATVFSRLRWAVGGEFSVTINSAQAELLLDALDDVSIARMVRERDASDTGERVSLDAVIAEHGFTRAELTDPPDTVESRNGR